MSDVRKCTQCGTKEVLTAVKYSTQVPAKSGRTDFSPTTTASSTYSNIDMCDKCWKPYCRSCLQKHSATCPGR
jgi:hypothetical protein